MAESSEQVLLTFPVAWKIESYARKRNFASVQDFVRELVRRDIEAEE